MDLLRGRAADDLDLCQILWWKELLEGQARFGMELVFIEVAAHDGESLFRARDIEVSKQVTHVVEIVELLAQTHRRTFHSEEVMGLGDIDPKMRPLEIGSELPSRAEKAFDSVIEPSPRHVRPRRNPGRRLTHQLGGLENRVHVACRIARFQNETHDRAADDVKFSQAVLFCELGVEELEQMKDVRLCQSGHSLVPIQMRSPSPESTKMLRRRNGTGEARNKCRRKLARGTTK